MRVVYKTEKLKGFVLSSVDGKITDGSQTSQPSTSSYSPQIVSLWFLGMGRLGLQLGHFRPQEYILSKTQPQTHLKLSVYNKFYLRSEMWFGCYGPLWRRLADSSSARGVRSWLLFAITTASRQAVKLWLVFSRKIKWNC